MTLPTFKYTVTVFHQQKNEENPKNAPEWIKYTCNGCYFGTETIKQVSGTSLIPASNYVCRIPKKSDNGAILVVMPGDIIVKGEIADEVTDVAGKRPADLLNKYSGNAFMVRTVSDNDVLPYLPHIHISGV